MKPRITPITPITRISRREALGGLGIAAASVLFHNSATAQASPWRVGEQPVDLAISTPGTNTVRITILPQAGQRRTLMADGALVEFSEVCLTHARLAHAVAGAARAADPPRGP